MAGTIEWGRFGWHGIALDMPSDWCPGRFEGDFANGYVRVEDETEIRLEVRWETAGRRVSKASKLVDNYIKQVRKKTRRQDPNPEVDRDRCVKRLAHLDHEVFTWRGAYNAHSVLAVCPDTRRVVHLRVFFEDDELRHLTRRVFASLTTGPKDGKAEWNAFGFGFVVGDDWKLDTSGLRTGCLQFVFNRDSDELEVTRFSLAGMLLRETDLDTWFRRTFHKALRKFRYETHADDYCGYRALRCRGVMKLTARPFGLFRRRRHVTALAWHDTHADKVAVVRIVTTTANDPQVEAIAGSISPL